MRHHGRPDDADRRDEHPGLGEPRRRTGRGPSEEIRAGLGEPEDLEAVAKADRQDEDRDDRLDQPHPEALQGEESRTSKAVIMIAQCSGM